MFFPSSELKKYGTHITSPSYVFLLFEQPADFNTQTEVTPATSIANFNISQFALDVGLGNALGGTFMLVGPDPTA